MYLEAANIAEKSVTSEHESKDVVPDFLCTLCLRNFGLRQEAKKVAGELLQEPCPNCSQIGGVALDKGATEYLMENFFINGSVPPEAGGPAPVYQFNGYRHPGEVTFETELDVDVKLLSDFLGVGLFLYGPPMWRLGYTDHYNALRDYGEDKTAAHGEKRKVIWDDILTRCIVRSVESGTEIYRVRKGEVLPPALPVYFDTPPEGCAGDGRYHSADLPIFYGSDDIETCLHESRVSLADYIALATFTPSHPIRLVDLSDGIDDSSARTPFGSVEILMRKLAYVGKRDYDLCRELAHEIHNRGFDGFFFTSYFSQAHKNGLRNIALFGRPAIEEKLRLISVNRIRLTSVAYEYAFGPSNDAVRNKY